MMATATLGPDSDAAAEVEKARPREEVAENEEIPFDFFIRPNIPRPYDHGYFLRRRLVSYPKG
jgi:hypothetical protein